MLIPIMVLFLDKHLVASLPQSGNNFSLNNHYKNIVKPNVLLFKEETFFVLIQIIYFHYLTQYFFLFFFIFFFTNFSETVCSFSVSN